MGSGPWSLLKRYGLAAVLTALAILASVLLAPHWNPRHLLLPFCPAVMLSAWFGGFGPGLFTTLLSALAMDYFWLPPTFAFGMQEPGDLIGFVLFLGVGLLVSALNARLLRAQRHAEAAATELRREVDERRKAEEAAVLAPGVVISNQELTWQRSDRMPLSVLVNARAAEGLVECLAIDITDRERAEEAERQTTRLRTLADLAAAAAHEINGPLTTVLTNLALLRLDGEPAPRVDKALEAARRI